MSYNPAFDPRDERNQREQQQRRDEQYAREMANRPVPASYGQPVYSQPIATPVSTTRVNETNVVVPSDKVRWGPILAGLVSALSTLLVLEVLGVAVGLTAAAGDPNATATNANNVANNYGTGAAIWAAVSALIAFFLGGYIAGRTTAARNEGKGWLNGALVWAVALPLLLWLAGSGASGFLNAIGFNLNGFFNTINPSNPASPTNNPGTVQNATEAARNGAWWTLLALLLGLLAASLGGFLGGRRDYDDDNVNVVR